MERDTQVVALALTHGENWTFFPEDGGTYAIARSMTLAELQRAVAEMTVHAQMRGTAPVPVPTPIPAPAYPYRRVRLSGLPA